MRTLRPRAMYVPDAEEKIGYRVATAQEVITGAVGVVREHLSQRLGKVTGPADVVRLLQEQVGEFGSGDLGVLWMSNKNEVLASNVCAWGFELSDDVDACLTPEQAGVVVRGLLESNAASVVFYAAIDEHGGKAYQFQRVEEWLKELLKQLDCSVVDFVVVDVAGEMPRFYSSNMGWDEVDEQEEVAESGCMVLSVSELLADGTEEPSPAQPGQSVLEMV